jgi:hypothetical protein
MLVSGPTSTLSPTRSLQPTIKYDMNSHYRFGGKAPQQHREPRHAPLHAALLEFITKEGTPGVMPSEPKLRVRNSASHAPPPPRPAAMCESRRADSVARCVSRAQGAMILSRR